MSLQIICRPCQKAFNVRDDAAGKYVRCPAGHLLAVPETDRTWPAPDEAASAAPRQGGLALLLALLGLLILAALGACLFLLLGEQAANAGAPRAGEPTASAAVKTPPAAAPTREVVTVKAEPPAPKTAPQSTAGRIDRLDRDKLDFRSSAADAGLPTPAVWDGHTNHVRRVAFTDDGQFVISVSGDMFRDIERPADNSIRVWDARTGKQVHKLEGFAEPISALSISPGGRYALFGHGGHWETVGGKHKYLPAKTSGVFLWDIQAKQVLGPGAEIARPGQGGGGPRFLGLKETAFSTEFAPGGKDAAPPTVLAAGARGGLALWETATGDVVFHRTVERTQGLGNGIDQARFTPDGRLVLAHSDHTIRIHRADNGNETCPPLKSHRDIIWALDIRRGPDGTTRILSAGGGQRRNDGNAVDPRARDYAIRLWDFDRQKVLRLFEGHTDNVHAVAFCPDGRHFVSSGKDKTVRLWDIETGRQVCVLGRHDGWARSVAVSPDGRSCVSGGYDCKVRFWQLPTE